MFKKEKVSENGDKMSTQLITQKGKSTTTINPNVSDLCVDMDMKRLRRSNAAVPPEDQEELGGTSSRGLQKHFAVPQFLGRIAALAISFVILWFVLFSSHGGAGSGGPPLDRLVVVNNQSNQREFTIEGPGDDAFSSTNNTRDKLLGGLLASGFDEASCLSRYQSILYRKVSSRLPSSYLVERLRKYEAIHKKCGPSTELYKKTVEQLKSGHSIETMDCNYVVWISYSGLGNRILTLASTFLYALLTDRVLLVDRGADMSDLFCEPFQETSWLLPLDFPLNQFSTFDKNYPQSYGNMLKSKVISSNSNDASKTALPAYVYIHLNHDYGDLDKLFFCDEEQVILQKIPWLVLRSDNYFVPSLFLMPAYEEELRSLFPERDTVFHHLGRYLFHPTNSVWGLITRYYLAYLAKADERVGIQIRVFDTGSGPFQHVLDQILACSFKNNVLPDVKQEEVILSSKPKSKALLITSLNAGYFEKIRSMYWEHPTANGEIIGVYQPSHEEYQKTEKQMHNMKAWAEMYLLSMTDMLITSSWSTFGYVAQGLGGIKSWIMYKPENQTAPDPPCRRAMSMEPCFHAPPFYDCKAKRGVDTGELVPHVKHCEDMSWGLKLVNQDEW